MAVVVATSVVSGCGTGPSLLCLHSAVASRVFAPGSGVITNKARATFGGCCFSKSRQFSARQLLPSFQIPIEFAARETISTEFSPSFCTCCSSHSRKSPVTYLGLFDRSFFGLSSSSLQLSSSSQNQRKSAFGFAATAMDATEKRKKVLVPVANGTEEMEAVILIDVLRRAGADVTVASVEEEQHHIVAANGVVIVADALISECEGQEFDLVALPVHTSSPSPLGRQDAIAFCYVISQGHKSSPRMLLVVCYSTRAKIESTARKLQQKIASRLWATGSVSSD
jgi:hypothetical protein